MSLPQFSRKQKSGRIFLITAIVVCICTATCHAYRLVGSEALSDALVAHHYSINATLDAVIVVDKTIPTFEYQTFYAMGSADEPEGQQGELHFLEHIIADAGSRPPGELAELIGANGGQYHATTDLNLTNFRLRFPRDKLPVAVEIDRDGFYSTVINNEVVEKQRQIVLTELRRNLARSSRRFSSQFWGMVYGRDKLEGVGTEALINDITPGDLKQLFHNVFRRKRRLIVVIGDIDVADVLARLVEAFPAGKMEPQRGSSLSRFPSPDVLGERYQKEFEHINRSRFRKTWHIPELGHPDYAGAVILASILERSSNSLRTSLLDSQIASSFSVWIDSQRGFGLLSLNAVMAPVASTEAIESAISDTLNKIKTHGITEDELEAARNTELRHLYSEFYDRSELAKGFGAAFAHTGDPLLYARLVPQIRQVLVDDIQRIVNEYFIQENAITLSWTMKEKHPPWAQLVVVVVLICVPGGILIAAIRVVRKRTSGRENVDDEETRKYHC